MVGNFARSKAGHDRNKVYVIINEDTEYVYLSDGRLRTIDHPKRKKKKHIQLVYNNRRNPIITTQNEDIKRAIRMFKED
jgi:ribosome biogenesis protein Nip4